MFTKKKKIISHFSKLRLKQVNDDHVNNDWVNLNDKNEWTDLNDDDNKVKWAELNNDNHDAETAKLKTIYVSKS